MRLSLQPHPAPWSCLTRNRTTHCSIWPTNARHKPSSPSFTRCRCLTMSRRCGRGSRVWLHTCVLTRLVPALWTQARVLQLCRLLDLRKMPQGSIVCRRGEKCESMFFVVRGWVDEIKYFKTAETNKWATDLSRTQFVENTQTRCVSAVVNQLGPKSYVPPHWRTVRWPLTGHGQCARRSLPHKSASSPRVRAALSQVLWAGVHASEGPSVPQHDAVPQRVSLASASPGRPDGTEHRRVYNAGLVTTRWFVTLCVVYAAGHR